MNINYSLHNDGMLSLLGLIVNKPDWIYSSMIPLISQTKPDDKQLAD